MKQVTRLNLIEAADRTMLKLSEEEIEILLQEFDVFLTQLDIMGRIEGIDDVIPMTFPYDIVTTEMREDVACNSISKEEALKNASKVSNDQIVIPKVI